MLNVLIPMAGRGSRFEKAGYKLPKPLIQVNGKPMIQIVIDNLNLSANYIFLALKEHCDKYDLRNILPMICGNSTCQIVEVDTITEGAACTALLAKQYINNSDELIIANSDQWVNWSSNHFIDYVRSKNADAGIVSFLATHSKWSFAKVEETGIITEVAEKNPISNVATVGIYYYKEGRFFVDGAENMISKNIRVLNEFYIAPVFNELIADGKLIYNYPIAEMCGLGTPEDLDKFLLRK